MAAVFFCIVMCLLTCCSAYENLALNKPAKEEYPYNYVNTDASKAVDGLKSDLTGLGGQCSLSANYQRTSTWWVNLTSIRSIHDIRIYYRTDNVTWSPRNGNTHRFLGFSIYVSNTTSKSDGTLCYKDNNFTKSTIPAVFNTTCFVHGQYVIYYNERLQGVVYPDGYSDYAFNDLCEVEVYGCTTPGFYGMNCTIPCPGVNCRYCHIETGTCQRCKPGYKGDQCELECDNRTYGKECEKECGHCVNMTLCYHVNGSCFEGCDPGYRGSRCHLECTNNKYGDGCQTNCGHCVNMTQCHHVNGTCFDDCDPGYEGQKCDQECNNNKYGDGCQTDCGHCFNMSQCHHVNGTCFDGCDPGYEGQKCNQECQNRTYGYRCRRRCGHCLNRTQCDHVNGTCLQGCEAGYGGSTCNLVNLSLHKPAYEENIYIHANVTAGKAVDGRKSNLHGIGGECSTSKNNQRTATWWVNLETINSIHDIRIYYRTDNVDWGPSNGNTARFLGFSIYVSNTTDKSEGKLCYKDDNFTTSTIPAVFNTTCFVHGQYIIYYNERLLQNTHPTYYSKFAFNDLCEVEVYGCPRPGYYGIDCNLPCPDVNCRYCHIEWGTCQGCTPGYKGHQCELECDKEWYGDECQRQCGHCINMTQCNHVNGTCSQGCEVGYEGQTCDQECQDGYFGENCIRNCSAYCNSCNKKSGVCDLGCHPGWKGTYCTEECDGGLFGVNCSIMCGHCLNNQQCHHINGTCVNGCDPGYRGVNCTEVCPAGTFGMNCNNSCSTNCRNSDDCNPKTGDCIGGCKDGMKGAHCNKKCDNNMFGKNCAQMCGQCINSTQCHHVNGSCSSRCDLGFQGQLCNKACINGRFGYDCLQNCSSLCVNETCDKKYGNCEKIATQTSDSDNNSPFIGVGVGLLIILIASVLVFIIVRRYRKSSPNAQPVTNNRKEDEMRLTGHSKSKMNTPSSSNGRPTIVTTPLNDDINGMTAEDPEYFNVTKTSPDIAVDKLEAVIAEKGKNENEGFRKEYAALPSGELHKCEIGKKPENFPKNRYKTTFPYDHSRVVLYTRGSEKSDYIHANYIEGPNRKKEYIATQGPKPNTLGDFWRMIWQEQVTTIVMVTNLKEGEKLKCNKYWPDKDKPTTYGPVLVTLLEEKEYAFYTTRQLSVYNKENRRITTQYHYTAWPDHGVPEPLCLLTFHSHVINTSANNSQGPTTVHCSAGVGRTGTYIALDALYQIGKRKGKVNPAEFVAKMRQNRVSMVQTYEQYITIFLALNEIFKAPIKVDSMAEFSSKANKAGKDIPANTKPGRKEFQLLLQIRPNYTKDDYKFAINSLGDKETDEIMPLDKYSLHLSTGIPKRGSYINAITVPSFTNSQGFIVTKYPLPEDAVDLLRLLINHESDTVIFLQPLRYIESSNAWFPAVSSSLKISPYSVTHQSKSHTDVTSHVIQIHKEGDDDHTVMVIEPDAEIHCSGNSSDDPSYLRSLVSTVLDIETKKPITILSSDGASLCGLFIAVHNVIQQMNMDDRVDVFTAVRQLQIRRPEFCAKFEEYEMIYRAVLDYNQRESENIYCNQ